MAQSRKSERIKIAQRRARRLSSDRRRRRRCRPPPTTKPRECERVSPIAVEMKRGSGSPKAGGMPGGFFWHIYHLGQHVGRVFVNYHAATGRASIQIFLNRKSQSKGIGRIAYQRACEQCGYPRVYALMKRSNVASQKAANAAGFYEVPLSTSQVTMLWTKTTVGQLHGSG